MTRKEKKAVETLVTQIRKHLSNTFSISELWDAVYEVEKLTGIPIHIDVMKKKSKKKGKR